MEGLLHEADAAGPPDHSPLHSGRAAAEAEEPAGQTPGGGTPRILT